MMRQFILLGFIFSLLTPVSVTAIPVSWQDTWSASGSGHYFTTGEVVSFQHDLSTDGYRAGVDLVTAYELNVLFSDDGDDTDPSDAGYRSEFVSVDVVGLGGTEAPSVEIGGRWPSQWQELVSIQGLINAVDDLSAFGTLDVVVTSIRGDLLLLSSTLSASGYLGDNSPSVEVPEPPAAWLLMAGLLVILGQWLLPSTRKALHRVIVAK